MQRQKLIRVWKGELNCKNEERTVSRKWMQFVEKVQRPKITWNVWSIVWYDHEVGLKE
jgi:hypothetical protein